MTFITVTSLVVALHHAVSICLRPCPSLPRLRHVRYFYVSASLTEHSNNRRSFFLFPALSLAPAFQCLLSFSISLPVLSLHPVPLGVLPALCLACIYLLHRIIPTAINVSICRVSTALLVSVEPRAVSRSLYFSAAEEDTPKL